MRRISSELTFLDEFRLIATTSVPTVDYNEPDLVIFDTSIPQQSPGSWQSFNVSVRHPRSNCDPSPRGFRVHTDGGKGREAVLTMGHSSLIRHNP